MTFLPVVDRELRVAARRKSIRYVRAAAAMLGIVVGFFQLLLAQLFGSSSGIGNYIFTFMAWYTLLLTLLAGIFLASDTLSEERREGTLGLLFLTDLKGYDVVLGKFMAVSLNAFYGLLALFPVLSLTMLTGGVTPAEFWRTCLALINLLFVSISAGMLVSSWSRSTYRAMLGTIGLLVAWLVITALAPARLYYLSETSPFNAFITASAAHYFRLAREFWTSLAVSHAIGWLFLGVAGWNLRSFVDKAKTAGRWRRILNPNLSGKSVRREQLLEINPVLWLLDDSRRLRWVTWLLSVIGVILLIILGIIGQTSLFFSYYATWPVYFLLKVFFAVQACRFFGEARRTGALELLCCTPLSMRTLVQGQWMMLRRIFLWPVVVLLAIHTAALLVVTLHSGGVFGAASVGSFPNLLLIYQLKIVPNTIADFVALAQFGMWLALTMQRPNMAAGLALLCIVVIPTFIFCLPSLVVDAVFIAVSTEKLSRDFRLRQAQWATPKTASRGSRPA